MKPASASPPPRRLRFTDERGNVLLIAMLLATAIALGLVGYLDLGRTSLKLAHRSFYANDAGNLAEAGIEEAVYCFNQLAAGTAPATAWTGWTLSGGNATRTLTFNRDQNAVGVVKVFVNGYDGSNNNPYVISQATITPFDGGAPVVRVLRVGLTQRQTRLFTNGVYGLGSLTMSGKPTFDSFNSNPTNSPTGPWRPYSSDIAGANTTVVVLSGTVDLGNGKINGSLSLGNGVTPPSSAQVAGAIQTDYSGSVQMPVFPTPASVNQSYNLGSGVPATLPRTADVPAADGRYYYFVSGATIGATTITAGRNVTIVGSQTSLRSGLAIQTDATCIIYMDGTVSASGRGAINNTSWAGALQIFTSTTGTCEISGNGELTACLFAPYAALVAHGGGSGGGLVGSFVARTITAKGHVDFHYDEALRPLFAGASSGAVGAWSLTSWFESQSAADRVAVTSQTNNFLP